MATYESEGRKRLGVVREGFILDAAALARRAGTDADPFADMAAILLAGNEAIARLDALSRAARHPASVPWALPLSRVKLGAPVPSPSKIIAVGLNYRAHAEEIGSKAPKSPVLFAKWPNSLTGPFDPILLHEGDNEADYEGELAVVIGKRAKHLSESTALSAVAGYMVLNDVSERKWQFADGQWTRGKSCDTFCPTGPWLTTADEIPDPGVLSIETRVNGEILQDSNTSYLLFSVPALLAFISESITLEPGDIIATGTPPGVGFSRKPPIFLKKGDVVEVEIERLGGLRNAVE